eukprot:8755097-Lingulodinium_polyedra.AAC.1
MAQEPRRRTSRHSWRFQRGAGPERRGGGAGDGRAVRLDEGRRADVLPIVRRPIPHRPGRSEPARAGMADFRGAQ